MGEYYRLVILSNTDDPFLEESVPRLGADFPAAFTAEQTGFYKPRYGAFEYMLDELAATPDGFVHVSSHTRYDLMPAHDFGFRNLVLLDRLRFAGARVRLVRVESLDEVNTLLGI